MKRTLVLGFALSVLAANAAFAGSQQESPVINASQTQVLVQDGAERTLDQQQKQLDAAKARIAENGSSQTVDRLHKQLGVAENGSSKTIDRLHSEMNVAENGSEHTVDQLHSNMVAESGGDTVFNAHLKA